MNSRPARPSHDRRAARLLAGRALLARRALLAGRALLALALAPPAAVQAAPGTTYVVLQPGSAAGDFDAAAWLADPTGWPARSASHPDGWGVAYWALEPPPGWERPFVLRGGGPGAGAGALNPRLACALAEMLPARSGAAVALLDAPDSAACSPGKPNPFPLSRDGWLFIHDGFIGIEAVTNGLWQSDLGPGWGAFKLDHPRDYDGNSAASRGNAGEIYFLALLHELLAEPEDVPRALSLTLARMAGLAGAQRWQANAILQRPDCTWAVRYAWSDEELYPVYFGSTAQGEYCVTDSLPAAGGSWIEVPNRCLAVLPAGGQPTILPLEFDSLGDPAAPGDPAGLASRARQPRLHFAQTPAAGRVRLRFEIPGGGAGRLELFDLQGRLLARAGLPVGRGDWTWNPPAEVSGIVLGRLTCAAGKASARTLLLR